MEKNTEKISSLHWSIEQLLEVRLQEVGEDGGGAISRDQCQSEKGVELRKHWHNGYATALKDVMIMLRSNGTTIN